MKKDKIKKTKKKIEQDESLFIKEINDLKTNILSICIFKQEILAFQSGEARMSETCSQEGRSYKRTKEDKFRTIGSIENLNEQLDKFSRSLYLIYKKTGVL